MQQGDQPLPSGRQEQMQAQEPGPQQPDKQSSEPRTRGSLLGHDAPEDQGFHSIGSSKKQR
jgi:hypothetical protein